MVSPRETGVTYLLSPVSRLSRTFITNVYKLFYEKRVYIRFLFIFSTFITSVVDVMSGARDEVVSSSAHWGRPGQLAAAVHDGLLETRVKCSASRQWVRHGGAWQSHSQTPFTRYNRLSNRLYKRVWQPDWQRVWQPVVSCIQTFYPVVKPVWQPAWQQVVSCKRGFIVARTEFSIIDKLWLYTGFSMKTELLSRMSVTDCVMSVSKGPDVWKTI